MIEILCIVAGAVVGFIIGALVYRNNAEQWQEKAQELEDKFDAEVARLKEQAKQYEATKASPTKE